MIHAVGISALTVFNDEKNNGRYGLNKFIYLSNQLTVCKYIEDTGDEK